MKLSSYEVKINPNTLEPDLLLEVRIPLKLIESVDTLSRGDAIQLLGQQLLGVFDEIKNEADTQG